MSEIKPEMWLVELGQGMGPLRLGATAEEVMRCLAEGGVEQEDDDEMLEGGWYVDDMDMELNFKSTKPPVLLEIEVWDDRVKLGPLEVIDQRLHTIVERLQVSDAETVWRLDRDGEDRGSPGDGELPLTTDNVLLSRGTLWIPHLGLGLTMLSGEVGAVRVRRPEETPQRGLGSLTASQRELSARGDLPSYLYSHSESPSPRRSWWPTVLNLALAVALGLTMWKATDYQRQWSDAVLVEGDVIATEPPPPDPFPNEYTVAYRDQTGQPHQVTLKRADVYATPHVGEKLELRYLPELPDQPLGPARYQDAAFDKFFPIGIGILVVYGVIQIALPLIGFVAGSLKQKLQSQTV